MLFLFHQYLFINIYIAVNVSKGHDIIMTAAANVSKGHDILKQLLPMLVKGKHMCHTKVSSKH